jgi:hypothetical protein
MCYVGLYGADNTMVTRTVSNGRESSPSQFAHFYFSRDVEVRQNTLF